MDAKQDQLPLDEEAYRLHLRGVTIREIARRLHKSHTTIQGYINRIRAESAEMHKANREQLIAEHIDSLAHIKALALQDHEVTQDVAFLNTARSCEADIIKLRGLAQPEVDIKSGAINITYVNDWRKDG